MQLTNAWRRRLTTTGQGSQGHRDDSGGLLGDRRERPRCGGWPSHNETPVAVTARSVGNLETALVESYAIDRA